MPYVLKHKETGELLSYLQPNGGDAFRRGLALWTTMPGEAERVEALERAGLFRLLTEEKVKSGRHDAEWELVQEMNRWQPAELKEAQARLAHAMLERRPLSRLFLRNGELKAEE
ncbi:MULTISPECIES: hypothetical protein [Cohnella]|jgi:hypothetical protein|uniref:hypothetical protein n=1 Tax=Cohnella TaxID=329857 RepID=UPI000E375AEE|nr:hypothetical protein [Cohnella sp.]REK68731.1 MAG: hypothetical protein C6P35_00565 [Cohnella sp.]